ncbi:asparagine--tRNA ligase [Acidobacteriota bacterium]
MVEATVKGIAEHEGSEITLRCWLFNKRSSGKILFLMLRDGTGYIQAIGVKDELSEEQFELCTNLPQESSLVVTGRVRADKRSPGGFELQLTSATVIQESDPYPITKKEHGPAFLLDHRHLWLRSKRQRSIMRIRHEIVSAIRDFFNSRDYLLIDTPILTPSAAEGTSTLFETDYFDQKAYLAQTGQLYLEPACMSFGKVYCFGPTFRAEKSKTRRHLTEFWMVEPEVAWARLDDIMDLAEEFISEIVARVLDRRMEDLKILERDTSKLEAVKRPFPRMTYTKAVELLQKKGMDIEYGQDFGGDEETVLSKESDKPLCVHRYPRAVKAFYMEPDPEDPDLALCVDMLAPEGYGEIIGGSERMFDHDTLLAALKEHGLSEDTYRWYLDIRRYGSVPHAGFGLGLERTVTWICRLDHLREAIPYPRMINRLYP